MDEMNWSLPPDLEHALERFYSVPEPSPAFAARLEQQLAIRQADLLGAGPALEPRERRSLVHVLLTRLHILKDSAAQPHSPSKPERKSLMLSLRTRPLVVIALALLLLLALTGVVYAVGNLLGYIPGIGIIDHTSQVRVLAEPLSQTRAGVTITVTKAFLGANKALIVFQVDGLSADK